MRRKLTLKVQGHFDKQTGPLQTATLVVDPNSHSLSVRVLRRRAAMTAGLDQLSEMVYQRAVMAEVAAKKPPKNLHRFRAKRGLL